MTRDEVLGAVLRREGWPKVSDRPGDLGGLTKGGVTIVAYNGYRARRGLRAVTRDEFPALSEADARVFYADEYFAPFAFVQTEVIFVLLTDWAVNAGIDDPTRALQLELQSRGWYRGTVDGVPGPMTRAAWSQCAGDAAVLAAIHHGLVEARIEFHFDRAFDPLVREFLRTHPTTQLQFLRGWIRRAWSFVPTETTR